MSRRDDWLLIEDMHIASKRILSYTRGMQYQTFLEDEKTIDVTQRGMLGPEGSAW